MSQVRSPVQYYNLFKSFMIVFALQAIVVLFTPISLGPIWRFLIVVLNMVISVVLGWRLYRRLYHMVFTFDSKGFTLRKGKREETSRQWNEFSKVSLVRTEYGDFSVRLYQNADFFDLPASKLKLNPFDFRFEVMRLTSSDEGKR